MRRAQLIAVMVTASGVISQLALAGATKPEHGYVTNEMQLPTSNSQARSFGRDMDGDGERDNALGAFYAVLAGQGFDVVGMQNQAIAEGDILMLHSVRATSLGNTKEATWQVLYGEPTPDPDFSGSGSFTVQTSGPRSLRLPATIEDHRVRTAPGAIPVNLDIAGVFTLPMVKARVFATCTPSECSAGRINGAVKKSEVNDTLLPELASLFNEWIVRDCPSGAGSCAADSQGKTVQELFDEDDDGTITTVELRTNSVIKSSLAPDLDLLKNDGIKESLSFGFTFTAVAAELVR